VESEHGTTSKPHQAMALKSKGHAKGISKINRDKQMNPVRPIARATAKEVHTLPLTHTYFMRCLVRRFKLKIIGGTHCCKG